MYITAYQLISECILLFIISWNAMITIFFNGSYERVIHNPVHLSIRVKGICRQAFSQVNASSYALKIIVFVGGRMFLDSPCLIAKSR